MHLVGRQWYYLTHALRLYLLYADTQRRKRRGRDWMTSYIDKNHHGRVSSLNVEVAASLSLFLSFTLSLLSCSISAITLFREFIRTCIDVLLVFRGTVYLLSCRHACDPLVNRSGYFVEQLSRLVS